MSALLADDTNREWKEFLRHLQDNPLHSDTQRAQYLADRGLTDDYYQWLYQDWSRNA